MSEPITYVGIDAHKAELQVAPLAPGWGRTGGFECPKAAPLSARGSLYEMHHGS